jgi:hypothetical protein
MTRMWVVEVVRSGGSSCMYSVSRCAAVGTPGAQADVWLFRRLQESCEGWAKLGECQRNTAYMEVGSTQG